MAKAPENHGCVVPGVRMCLCGLPDDFFDENHSDVVEQTRTRPVLCQLQEGSRRRLTVRRLSRPQPFHLCANGRLGHRGRLWVRYPIPQEALDVSIEVIRRQAKRIPKPHDKLIAVHAIARHGIEQELERLALPFQCQFPRRVRPDPYGGRPRQRIRQVRNGRVAVGTNQVIGQAGFISRPAIVDRSRGSAIHVRAMSACRRAAGCRSTSSQSRSRAAALLLPPR